MTSDDANTPTGPADASDSAGGSRSVSSRSSGRSRHSRGRRRPRRSSNRPQRQPHEAPEAAGSDPETNEEGRREPLPPPFQPAKVESIQAAIEKVTAIMGDLRDVLNDMELVLEYLEDAERQQIADEREIESLQQRLNTMHRRPASTRPSQRPDEEAAESPR